MTDPLAGPVTEPLARPYRRLSPLTPVVRSFIVLVAAGTTVVRDVTQGRLGYTAIVLGLVLVGGGLFGLASWVRTKFWIEADELRVDTGVVSRQSRRIRIDRLQGIDIVQPFVARLFGLAELRMDVAGGNAREGSLAFLPLGDARELKDLLLARRDEVRRADPATPGVPPTTHEPVPAPADRPLAHVDLGMLLLSILLSPESLVFLLVGLGVLVAFAASGAWLGASAMLPVLLGVGLAIFRKFSANYRFAVTETAAGMQVRRGLFDLSSQTISLARVQGVVVSEPLLWRALGWARLDVSIAGYGSGTDEGPAPSTVLPVGNREVVLWLARYVLREADLGEPALVPAPPQARWAAPVAHRFMAAGTTERLALSREGWLTRRTHVASHARIQSLRVTQGPWQRRLGLADVHLDSPPGPANVRARNRRSAEARDLFEREIVTGAVARRGC